MRVWLKLDKVRVFREKKIGKGYKFASLVKMGQGKLDKVRVFHEKSHWYPSPYVRPMTHHFLSKSRLK